MNKIKLSDVLPHGVAIALFLVITISFFSPIFFENRTLDQHDIQQHAGSSKALRDKLLDAMTELDSLTVHSRREEGRGQRRRVNTALVGEPATGDWLLIFLDGAREPALIRGSASTAR